MRLIALLNKNKQYYSNIAILLQPKIQLKINKSEANIRNKIYKYVFCILHNLKLMIQEIFCVYVNTTYVHTKSILVLINISGFLNNMIFFIPI